MSFGCDRGLIVHRNVPGQVAPGERGDFLLIYAGEGSSTTRRDEFIRRVRESAKFDEMVAKW
jgi:hypothetical protein